MTNNEFISMYVTGKVTGAKANGHCAIADHGARFYNYSTELCYIDRKNMIARVNTRKYSRTTGRIQTALLVALAKHGYIIEEYKSEKQFWFWNYGYQGVPNIKQSQVSKYFEGVTL